MVTIMTEQKAVKARNKSDAYIEDLRSEIAKAKLTILGAEKQLEVGSIPFSAISNLEESIGVMSNAATNAEVYDNLSRFLSDLRSIA